MGRSTLTLAPLLLLLLHCMPVFCTKCSRATGTQDDAGNWLNEELDCEGPCVVVSYFHKYAGMTFCGNQGCYDAANHDGSMPNPAIVDTAQDVCLFTCTTDLCNGPFEPGATTCMDSADYTIVKGIATCKAAAEAAPPTKGPTKAAATTATSGTTANVNLAVVTTPDTSPAAVAGSFFTTAAAVVAAAVASAAAAF